MLGNRNLVIDTLSEVYNELRPYRDYEFWDFASHEPIANSVYVLGRQQVVDNADKFRNMAQDPRYVMVFGNSAEGSSTLVAQLKFLKLEELILQGRILLIGGGDMEHKYPYIQHDHFLSRIFDYEENLSESARIDEIFTHTSKPYKFLFLNGRARPHRKYLWERLRQSGLLDQSLWTMLDGRKIGASCFTLVDEHNVDVMRTNTPIRYLPNEYEVDRYINQPSRQQVNTEHSNQFVKNELFANEWGEIYLQSRAYVDTYFSLVTETVFDYPYSFRTEKIAKVLAQGHPWICATSPGFYRDLRNLGFQTFDTLINESFDLIDDHQTRMDRIHDIVQDLCNGNLAAFLAAAQDICKYNQQHLLEIAPKIRSEFPGHFIKFIEKHTT